MEKKIKAYFTDILYILLILTIITVNWLDLYNVHGFAPKGQAVALTIALILVYLIFAVMNANMLFKMKYQKNELAYQKLYNKTMEDLVTDLHKFKHKYDNDLSVLGGYIKAREWENLERYYEELAGESRGAADGKSLTLLNIKNAGVLGLLTAKREYAREKGVALRINVQDELKEVNMRMSQLCEILGVFLDNAVEAAAESEKKLVKVDITNSGKEIIFCIANSTQGSPPMGEIYKKNYTTKGAGRGFGLWQAKNIINNYTNVLLNTYCHESMFEQELIIS